MTVEDFWKKEMILEQGDHDEVYLDVSLPGDKTFYLARVIEVEPDSNGRFSARLAGNDGETRLWVKADGDEELYDSDEGDVVVNSRWLHKVLR